MTCLLKGIDIGIAKVSCPLGKLSKRKLWSAGLLGRHGEGKECRRQALNMKPTGQVVIRKGKENPKT